MIALLLVLLPTVACLLLAANVFRPKAAALLVTVGLLTSGLSISMAVFPASESLLDGYILADAASRLFLPLINSIYLGISVYVLSRVSMTSVLREEISRFSSLALLFLAGANLALIANHLGLAWMALEVTTLAAAPLIVRKDVPASRLASWRYILFSSVGLGLAFLGFACLARGVEETASGSGLFFDQLPALVAASPSNAWTRLGLCLVFLGLGAKLGLAPMYNWLPDVYEEAPPSVAALLGAIQFNCALVVLFRVVGAYRPGNVELVTNMLIGMGLLSMVVSTFNIIATRNMKRLIAYASINHAGVIAIGLGIGGSATYGLVLYAISNAFIKVILFLTVGKIKASYQTKDTRKISGLLRGLPYSGAFLMVGTFALLGFPPFGSFFGELLILSALVGSGHLLVFGAFCMLIIMTFVATGRTIFPMIWGAPKEEKTGPRQTFISSSPKAFFLAALVILGIYIPPAVNALIQDVSATLDSR